MIEGSGSIPLTNGSGSGSGRPKTCGSGTLKSRDEMEVNRLQEAGDEFMAKQDELAAMDAALREQEHALAQYKLKMDDLQVTGARPRTVQAQDGRPPGNPVPLSYASFLPVFQFNQVSGSGSGFGILIRIEAFY